MEFAGQPTSLSVQIRLKQTCYIFVWKLFCKFWGYFVSFGLQYKDERAIKLLFIHDVEQYIWIRWLWTSNTYVVNLLVIAALEASADCAMTKSPSNGEGSAWWGTHQWNQLSCWACETTCLDRLALSCSNFTYFIRAS